jgi:hypothetical protein
MPILSDWKLELNVDDVLRAQGADPISMRKRRPAIIGSIEKAIALGSTLLHPIVLYEQYPVKQFVHDRLELITPDSANGKAQLSGLLIAQHMASAQQVIVLLCSIGKDLDESVSGLFAVDPMLAVSLDGVGSAAVELLAILAANHFETQARQQGLKSTMPLNPGMVGWPVDEGQLQIFTLLDSERIQVSLTDSFMMNPNKSLSMVIGIGKDVAATGSSCDYCSLKGVCKYQNHYAKPA